MSVNINREDCETRRSRRHNLMHGFRYDLLGIGQGMMDLAASVSYESLRRANLAKGSRTVVAGESDQRSVEELGVDGGGFSLNAGGSVSNTLAAVSLLSRAALTSPSGDPSSALDEMEGDNSANVSIAGEKTSAGESRRNPAVRVGMGGIVGSDVMGKYFVAEMERSGVEFISEPVAGTTTGKCVVLTTPDAQRTLVSDFGNAMDVMRSARAERHGEGPRPGSDLPERLPHSSEERCAPGIANGAVDLTPMLLPEQMKEALSSSAMVLIEGYLFEMGDSVIDCLIAEAAGYARDCGSFVVMTASDVSVVVSQRKRMREAVSRDVDCIFGNAEEAIALAGGRAVVEQMKRKHSHRFQFVDGGSDFWSDADDRRYVMGDAEAAARALGEQFPGCQLIVVTDGHLGSYIVHNEIPKGSSASSSSSRVESQLYVIPPCWTKAPPVDTCGAGDAYAAGAIFSLLKSRGVRRRSGGVGGDSREILMRNNTFVVDAESVHAMGACGSKAASRVIMNSGPRVQFEDAQALVSGGVSLPTKARAPAVESSIRRRRMRPTASEVNNR